MMPPVLGRAVSTGGIPIYTVGDIQVVNKPDLNFEGVKPNKKGQWFGAIQFTINEKSGEQKEYVLDNFLNFGAEGQTYTVVRKQDGYRMAAKFCNSKSAPEIELVQKLPRELVQHPNFIKYECILKDIGTLFQHAHHVIFMDLLPNGELFEFLLAAPTTAMSVGTCRRFLQDIIQGMAQCYRSGITHRDLKPENLMLNEEGRVVVIDLGHAKRAPEPAAPALTVPGGGLGGPPMPLGLEKATTTHAYGTPAFNAPEVQAGKEYVCELADVWSVGVVAFYLHAKLPSFVQGQGIGNWSDIGGEDNLAFWNKIEGSGFYRQFPADLKQFVNAFWRKSPKERPTFEHLILAINGDKETLTTFPGLQWVAKPTNDIAEFYAELRQTKPDVVLKEG